jgi:hypothetical protein
VEPVGSEEVLLVLLKDLLELAIELADSFIDVRLVLLDCLLQDFSLEDLVLELGCDHGKQGTPRMPPGLQERGALTAGRIRKGCEEVIHFNLLI